MLGKLVILEVIISFHILNQLSNYFTDAESLYVTIIFQLYLAEFVSSTGMAYSSFALSVCSYEIIRVTLVT